MGDRKQNKSKELNSFVFYHTLFSAVFVWTWKILSNMHMFAPSLCLEIKLIISIRKNDNEVMDSDDESTSAVRQEAETHTIAVGWDTHLPSTSTTKVKFDNFPDHFPTTSEEEDDVPIQEDDDDDDVPLGYDRNQQLQIQSLEDSVQQLSRKVAKLEQGINSLAQVCLENQTTKIQLKPIEALLQQIKGALIE